MLALARFLGRPWHAAASFAHEGEVREGNSMRRCTGTI
jgi:hypothetical protein